MKTTVTGAVRALSVRWGWLTAMAFVALGASSVWAQGSVGIWQGSLPVERDARVVVRISATDAGLLRGTFQRVDAEPESAAFSQVHFEGPILDFSSDLLGVAFRGTIAADGMSLSGVWTQDKTMYLLVLTKTAPEAVWRRGDRPALVAMAATADPAFEVATIKPSSPDGKGRRYEIRSRQFRAVNATVADLIKFAYGLRSRQISGAPRWVNEERFDIAGEPDDLGLPSEEQYHGMMRKLLVERFGLHFHEVQQSFPVYALTVAGESKLTPGDASLGLIGHIDVKAQPDGDSLVRFSSESLPEFTGILMNFIEDRQVVDETSLTGRFDFAMTVPTAVLQSTGGGEKTAAFLRAVQPLGLQLVPKKADLGVMVVERVERPSAN